MKWIKKTYIYIFSAVGLVLVVIGSVQLINLALKTWIFTKADVYHVYPTRPIIKDSVEEQQIPTEEEIAEYQNKEQSSRRQRQASNALAMIIVGIPLFAYHWNIVRKDGE